MSGDPRVLAPLQQAYLAAKHEKVIQRLQFVWDFETRGKIVNSDADADSEIRAWTAPPAEPSLEQRVAELERAQLHTDQSVGTLLDSTAMLRLTDDTLSNDVQSLHERMRVLEESEQHPEPTAPDDPVCVNCGCLKSLHGSDWCKGYVPIMSEGMNGIRECGCQSFLPAPQPAPDLDPVRVEEPNIESALKALGYAYQLLPRKHREYDAGAGGHMRDVFRRLTGITHEDAMSNEERIHNELMRLGEGVDRDWR